MWVTIALIIVSAIYAFLDKDILLLKVKPKNHFPLDTGAINSAINKKERKNQIFAWLKVLVILSIAAFSYLHEKKLDDFNLSSKTKQDPFITYPTVDEPIKYKQSNDTLFFYPAISNLGHSPAKNVNYKAYFLSQSILYWKILEYYKPIAIIDGIEIPENRVFTITSTTCFIPNFHFDKTNAIQYILVLGSYTDSEDKEKTMSLCYQWNVNVMKWQICTSEKKIEDIHNSQSIFKYFGQPEAVSPLVQ